MNFRCGHPSKDNTRLQRVTKNGKTYKVRSCAQCRKQRQRFERARDAIRHLVQQALNESGKRLTDYRAARRIAAIRVK